MLLEREHKAFEQRRSQHYNMRDAMRRARELMNEDDEDDNNNGGSSSKSTIPPVPLLPKLP
jgi:hypothetical protein